MLIRGEVLTTMRYTNRRLPLRLLCLYSVTFRDDVDTVGCVWPADVYIRSACCGRLTRPGHVIPTAFADVLSTMYGPSADRRRGVIDREDRMDKNVLFFCLIKLIKR